LVVVKPKEASAKYLKPEFVKQNRVRVIKPIEEMSEVESEYEGKTSMKVTGRVECQIEEKPVMVWSMNDTSRNTLISLFGPDTKDWQKAIQITVMPVSGHDSILVDEMGTAELHKKSGKGVPTLL
jgi:hypothetical protein